MICYLDSSALVKLLLATADIWRESLDVPVTFAIDLKLWKAAVAVGLVPYPQDLPELLESRKA